MRKSSDYFVHLSAGARQDLLRVLTFPSLVRADVIRQFHERGEDGMVDVLSDLEADELIRLQTIEALRRELDWDWISCPPVSDYKAVIRHC